MSAHVVYRSVLKFVFLLFDFVGQVARGRLCQHAWGGGDFVGVESQGAALACWQAQDLHQAVQVE